MGGYAISRQNNLELKFELPYLLIELFYIGIPVVQTDGWAYGHVITNFSQMGRLPHYLIMVLRCARFARESSVMNIKFPSL